MLKEISATTIPADGGSGRLVSNLKVLQPLATAGGEVKAARVQLKSVEIGTVTVRNVDALVLRGRTLTFPLVGMSYMNKLGTYSADNYQLRLVN